MEYTIKPSLAAIIVVYADSLPLTYGENSTTFIYVADGKPLEKGIGCSIEINDLPLKVRAAIHKHFGTVFTLPIGQRADYLKSFDNNPIVVEVQE